MAQKDYYIVKKNVDKIINNKYTYFLDPSTLNKVKSKLKGYNYSIYKPYKEAEKVMIYTKSIPKIKILEIISYDSLAHREIMGSLYSLLDSETFGDIIINNNHYYIMVIDSMYNIIKEQLKTIGNHPIKIKEVPIETIEKYQRKYEEIELIVSSTRIDTIVMKIIKISRDNVKKLIKEGMVYLNYEKVNKTSKYLNEGDIFSIRKHGKYKYINTVKNTKKGGYIIKCLKYTDN